MSLKDRIEQDLEESGLEPEDLGIKELDNSVRAATNSPFTVEGYVIPYLTIRGLAAPFYRVKLFDHDPKYKQPKETSNHIFFPKGFMALADKMPYVIFTEGEKKATKAVKEGFPCVAVGGTESWRNKLFSLPTDTELNKSSTDKLQAKIPAGAELEENFLSPLAMGMQDLIDYIISTGKHIIIIYDTDEKQKTSHAVQAAAATLGYELRFRGIAYNRIRQIRLPSIPHVGKIGIDDFLMNSPRGAFERLIEVCIEKYAAFPRHPNVRDYLNKRLQRSKMSRKEMQYVSMAVLSELDANGLRLRSASEGQTYYFDRISHKLMKANFNGMRNELMESVFGQYIYRQFGIGSADQKLVEWLGTQFTGEDPIMDVSPFKVFARPHRDKDSVILQISDGQFAEVNAEGMSLKDNGVDGVLFESGYVKPLDPQTLMLEYQRQSRLAMRPYWADTLSEVRLVDKDKQRYMTALLFYIAPWLLRWRGMQLPLEMTLGEAGSGKSTLQSLRMRIVSGLPHLRNIPSDMRDWTASVVNSGGLHILDNVQFADRSLRQRLSDEYCRIITEDDPMVEARKLYTNNEQTKVPVRVQFGITAIKQPFLNADILARSVIIELDKSKEAVDGNLTYDASWEARQLQRFGGREAWVAHHLLVLQRFFQLVEKKWNHKYQAKFRLINVEQAMCLMAEVFGIDPSWIPGYLSGVIAKATVDADWALEGIIAFGREWKTGFGAGRKFFTSGDMAAWFESSDDYGKNEELVNSRKLGRYLQTHKSIIATEAHIIENGKENNRIRYSLDK